MNNLSLKSIYFGIPRAFRLFLEELLHGFEFAVGEWKRIVVFGVILLAALLWIWGLIVKGYSWKDRIIRLLCACVLAVVTPIACNVAVLVSEGISYHMTMKMVYVCVVWIPLIMVEVIRKLELKKKSAAAMMNRIVCIMVFLIIFSNYLLTNMAYFNAELRYEKALGFANRIVGRIEEQIPDYNGEPIPVFIYVEEREGRSNVPMEEHINLSLTDAYIADITGANGDVILTTETHYITMITQHLGMPLSGVDEEEKEKIMLTNEFDNMVAGRVFSTRNRWRYGC